MRRQVNIFGERHLAFLQWALEVHINDLFAKISLLLDESDQAIFDLQKDVGALFNLLLESALGFDGKGFATASRQSPNLLSDRM